jgi:ABC-type multidrug transport system fused ATPase/permease subunit
MTPDEKSLLERTYKLAVENNDMLKSMRRSARWSAAFKIAYWAVIIALSIGAVYFIQPYLTLMSGSLGSLSNLSSNLNSANNAAQSLKDLLSK